jgi:8-hydroxy-5-deazaflavin:NADPH oxidoreductase
MNVTIIGAGSMGRGIGHRVVAGGHDVQIVDRDPEEAERLVEELRGANESGATVEASGTGAELRGEVVILAVYYPGNLEIARDLGEGLAGKVVVDISNPPNETFDGLATATPVSVATPIRADLRPGARPPCGRSSTRSPPACRRSGACWGRRSGWRRCAPPPAARRPALRLPR